MGTNDSFSAIHRRDAELHYCGTCGSRIHHPLYEDDPHNMTLEECEQELAKYREGKKPRQPDPDTGRLCWAPEQHHPFIEGEIPKYEEAERDRRTLLRYIEILRVNLDEIIGIGQ